LLLILFNGDFPVAYII